MGGLRLSTPTLVGLLLMTGCPPTVCRGVIPIVIDSIDAVGRPLSRHANGPNAHICKKIFKAIYPSLTYFNTSPTIVFISMIVGVAASLFHRIPRLIRRSEFRIPTTSVRQSRLIPENCNFRLNTTTRFCMPGFEFISGN